MTGELAAVLSLGSTKEPTLTLLTSLKTRPLRQCSRHRRKAEAFRIQLIASGFWGAAPQTPWDFIGEVCVPLFRHDGGSHRIDLLANNRISGQSIPPRWGGGKGLRL